MDNSLSNEYEKFRKNGSGFCERKRALIEVSGREAAQFLNGLITGDVAKLQDGEQMRAAFPNAQGRLLALVRVARRGDRFLFETEEATGAKVFQNLFRFTFAGDFYVKDLSDEYAYFELQNSEPEIAESFIFQSQTSADYFVPKTDAEDFKNKLKDAGAVEISDALDEVLRVENGAPVYGVDADETTIVSELGIDDLINYKKGCYIGQEIIARIYFRGHVAKRLTGLILEEAAQAGDELKSLDGKNAGRITSVVYSPTLEKQIALAFVRYDYLAEGTELKINETSARVKNLPFIK